MKHLFKILIIILLLVGCSLKNDRPEVHGYVYDRDTKKTISEVTIITEKGNETTTNKLGYFVLKKEPSTKIFDFESGHDPKQFFIILNHPNFLSDTIKEETRGSFENVKIYYSIYLQRK